MKKKLGWVGVVRSTAARSEIKYWAGSIDVPVYPFALAAMSLSLVYTHSHVLPDEEGSSWPEGGREGWTEVWAECTR